MATYTYLILFDSIPYNCVTTLSFSAVATYTAEEVKPSSDLGEKWLEVEAKRNCRHRLLKSIESKFNPEYLIEAKRNCRHCVKCNQDYSQTKVQPRMFYHLRQRGTAGSAQDSLAISAIKLYYLISAIKPNFYPEHLRSLSYQPNQNL